jgi:hypothetical protein
MVLRSWILIVLIALAGCAAGDAYTHASDDVSDHTMDDTAYTREIMSGVQEDAADMRRNTRESISDLWQVVPKK